MRRLFACLPSNQRESSFIEAFRRTQRQTDRRTDMEITVPPASHSKNKRLTDSLPHYHKDYYEGERLDRLLQSLQREIESARLLDGNALPENIWFKQQFAIGVNEVSRALERMTPMPQIQSHLFTGAGTGTPPTTKLFSSHSLHLQAVVVASDCNPKWLTKHLPSLALSRNVPLIFLRDDTHKHASLRLGQLFKLKTAIAIGIKAKGNSINQLFLDILHGDSVVNDGTDCPNSPTQLLSSQDICL